VTKLSFSESFEQFDGLLQQANLPYYLSSTTHQTFYGTWNSNQAEIVIDLQLRMEDVIALLSTSLVFLFEIDSNFGAPEAGSILVVIEVL